ncbi:hypothetical protein EJ02DRAFT_493133, partial [Clathrospora elynae]
GVSYNFLDIIKSKTKLLRATHKDNIVSFDSGFKLYILKDTVSYVLAVKYIDDSTIEKIRYSINGVILNHIIDSKNNYMVIRTSESNRKEIVFDDKKIITTKKPILLRAIEKPNKKNTMFVSNPNIGVIDKKTFRNREGIQNICALGFKTNLQDKPVVYYINEDDLDSTKIVLEMINELIRPKYNKTMFYCHNLSGYDIVFILKILCTHNENSDDKYNIKTILRNDKIIQLTISKVVKPKVENPNVENSKVVNPKVEKPKVEKSFIIRDSYAILPQSLSSLGRNFEVDVLKSIFPYKFSTQDNLLYIGETPINPITGD